MVQVLKWGIQPPGTTVGIYLSSKPFRNISLLSSPASLQTNPRSHSISSSDLRD